MEYFFINEVKRLNIDLSSFELGRYNIRGVILVEYEEEVRFSTFREYAYAHQWKCKLYDDDNGG